MCFENILFELWLEVYISVTHFDMLQFSGMFTVHVYMY